MIQALTAAGYPDEAIRAALANHAAAKAVRPVRGRAVLTITIAYSVVFVLLSVGMLANSRPRGYLMPDDAGGIAILAGSLIASFLLSMIWVAAPRGFGLLFFALLTAVTLQNAFSFLAYLPMAATYPGPNLLSQETLPSLLLTFLPPAIGILGLIWLMRRGPRGSGAVSFGALLAVPAVLVLGVAGICVASGLPIPGGR